MASADQSDQPHGFVAPNGFQPLPFSVQEFIAGLAKDQPGAKDSPLVPRPPGSVLLTQIVKAYDELKLPSGPGIGTYLSLDKHFASEATLEGRITRTLYVLPPGKSTFEIFAPMRERLMKQGFDIAYACAGERCGGSFRSLKYAWDQRETLVVPPNIEPVRAGLATAMFDGASDIRYVLFKRKGATHDTDIALFVGLNEFGVLGNVSVALSGRVGALVEIVDTDHKGERSGEVMSPEQIGAHLAMDGRVSLFGLDIEQDRTAKVDVPQLKALAEFLSAHPDRHVYVVAHSRSDRSVDEGIEATRARANAVVRQLATYYGIDERRLKAYGVGPLAPMASADNPDSRMLNARIDIVAADERFSSNMPQ